MIIILRILIITLLLFPFFTKSIHASTNFLTDYEAKYSILGNQTTDVEYKISLKNLTSNKIITSYKLILGFKELNKLKISDDNGTIIPLINKLDRGSEIILKFNEKNTGLNKSQKLLITFNTPEIAKKLNSIYEINIPGVSTYKNYNNIKVSVSYPLSLGNVKYIKPSLTNLSTKSGELIFLKEDLKDSGISIAFGEYQIYDIYLNYNLENKNIFKINKEIAIPPTTNYQDVLIESINPKPINIYQDPDGNWMAKYNLSPFTKTNIKVRVKIKVYLYPKSEELEDKNKELYLSAQKYWDSNNLEIISQARKLKTPFEIYKYVVNTLNYDYKRAENNYLRLGGLKSLNNKNSAVCLEFTDLFISIARAAGIPAREVNGYAYNFSDTQKPILKNHDILHAWPEYYDFNQKKWIMIDPTWAKTTGGEDYFNTLDYNHIAFVRKGISSTKPIPAGGYKIVSKNNPKDILVKLSSSFIKKEKVDVSYNIQPIFTAGLPVDFKVIVYNKGNAINNYHLIKVSSQKLFPFEKALLTNAILPFGKQELLVSFSNPNFLTNTLDIIKITSNEKFINLKYRIVPIYLNSKLIIGGIIFVSFIIIISAIAAIIWRLPIFRHKR